MPAAAEALTRRGTSCGVVDVDVDCVLKGTTQLVGDCQQGAFEFPSRISPTNFVLRAHYMPRCTIQTGSYSLAPPPTPQATGVGGGRSDAGSSAAIVSGSLVLRGEWHGCLAGPTGYSVVLGDVIIAQGAHGVVHQGVLLENGAQASVVAVKKSDNTEILRNEFSVYQDLEPTCPYIVHCFGFCISLGTFAF
ncbi:hypothetical protein B0H13DRAFT_1887075 [Mycena leptocephala]|nr:hypothetical protein B0H13DRAFT_1887075 [Mycena leptocephala]